MQWPDGEGEEIDADNKEVSISRSYMLTDERNWVSGLHGGGRPVHEGSVDKSSFGRKDTAQDCEKDGER